MNKSIYMQIFEEIIDHYSLCKRWKDKPTIDQCYACWQIDSLLRNVRAMGTANRNTTDRNFHTSIALLLNRMDYHNEQKRRGQKLTEYPKRPKVVRID